MKQTSIFSLSLLFLIFSTYAYAGTKAGDKEIGGQTSLTFVTIDSDDDDETQQFVGLGTFGYFFTDEMELSLVFLGLISEQESDISDSESTTLFAEIDFDYHFLTDTNFVPYIGPHLGIVSSNFEDDDFDDSSDTAFSYGGQMGFKGFLSENTAVDFQLRYTGYEAVDKVDQITFLVGFNFYF